MKSNWIYKKQIQLLHRLTIRRSAPESYQVRPEPIETFEPSFERIKQGEKRKRCHPKATHFSTKNPINKPAMNNRGLFIAAVFNFVYPVEKTVKKITS